MDQTDFQKVRFGRVKQALPDRKVVQLCMLSVQGTAVNMRPVLIKYLLFQSIFNRNQKKK